MNMLYPEGTANFLYNKKAELDLVSDYTDWRLFYLGRTVTVDSFGNKTNIKWKNTEGVLYIEEFPIYTRSKTGTGLLANFSLVRDLSIKFYREDSSFEEISFPTKTYSKSDRIEADIKSRFNVIEKTREKVGQFIYFDLYTVGALVNLETALTEATVMFDTYNDEINNYINNRNSEPLVTAIQNAVPTTYVTQSVLNYIISLININYYP